MLPDTPEEWIGSGIVTMFIAVVSLLWKIKHERTQAVEQAKKAAVDASASALGVVQAAMVTQGEQVTQLSQRVTEQDKQITNLNVRMTTLDQSHKIAISHIADREEFALKQWKDRPTGLPNIPKVLIQDVIDHNPDIRLYYQSELVSEEIMYAEEVDDVDDVDPKEGYSGYG